MAAEGFDRLEYAHTLDWAVDKSKKELNVEIDRLTGRIFVTGGINLIHYINDGKVWVSRQTKGNE